MKRLLMISVLALFLALPAFANGPMPTDQPTTSTSSGRPMSPGRKTWTKKRVKHLKQEMNTYKSAERTTKNIDRMLGAADNNAGTVMFPSGQSPAEHRRYMINRFEYLAIKAEHGRASANEMAEMRALQSALLGH
jgi:hypothetical protein